MGVKIGTVKDITFVYRKYDTEKDYVLVEMSIDPTTLDGKAADDLSKSELHSQLETAIAKGFRLRLAAQGLTGAMYIEGGLLEPGKYPPLDIDWKPRALYIPSAPSTIRQLTGYMESILTNLEQTDFKGLVEQANELIASTKNVMTNDLRRTLRNVEASTAELPDAAHKLLTSLDDTINEEVRPLLQNVRKTSETWPETMTRLNLAVVHFEQWASDRQAAFDNILQNAETISDNVEEMSDNTRDYPSLLLFGGAPPKAKALQP
jgi:phospholipid/cholesterol/gamma-HCH transport system substrate-binding protein/paraquat-inducible protein B